MIKPIRDGWAIALPDGCQIASFTGLGAKRRALGNVVSHDVLEEARDVR
jgi:hypothetical protein